jgi:transcriptional regulator with XRE-family HTH domain
MRVDPGSISTRQEFAAALTAVREAAGLTVREVARAANISPSTAGGYFSGRHLPPLRPDGGLPPILRACGVAIEDIDTWQLTLRRIRRPPGPRPGALPPPYLGLAPYGELDAPLFFGRDAEIDLLVEVLSRPQEPSSGHGLAVLLGPAGAGKTSLVRAGVVPRLRAAGRSVTVVTGGEMRSGHCLAACGMDADGSPPAPEVLVVDQLERAAGRGRGAVIGELAQITASLRRVSVLAVLRSEVVTSFPLHGQLADAVRSPALSLAVPDGQQLRSIVVGPARAMGLDVEDSLVDAVVTDALTVAGAGRPPLPRVSHALLATWQHGRGSTLSLAAYRDIGGVAGSIEAAAEEIHRSLPALSRPPFPVPAGWWVLSVLTRLGGCPRLAARLRPGPLRRRPPARTSDRAGPQVGC